MRIWPATTRTPRPVMALVLAASGLVASCGQKGALILPGPETTPAVEEADPADEDDEQERETDDAQDSD
ncbi:MAG: lipoprotein [Gammaproteobacteria bacterium]